MSAEIIKVYKQAVPALRFIGKKYGDADRIDGMFGKYWKEWFSKGWFDVIKAKFGGNCGKLYEDFDAAIGLMRWKYGEPFEYWIGLFTPQGTSVPEGYQFRDFAPSELGICWVYGKESEVFMQEAQCAEKLTAEDYKISADFDGACWFFERYAPSRFNFPDKKGNIVLDICHYLQ